MKTKECKSAKVLISMHCDFLKELDILADSEQRSRSELIREAVRFYKERNTKLTA